MRYGRKIDGAGRGRWGRVAAAAGVFAFCASSAWAKGTIELPSGGIGAAGPGQVSTVLQLLLLITVISLAPAILMMMTCFTRIIIVLSFLRRALATQQLPPDQIIIGLALFLSLAIMAPTFGKAYSDGVAPDSGSTLAGLNGRTTPRLICALPAT